MGCIPLYDHYKLNLSVRQKSVGTYFETDRITRCTYNSELALYSTEILESSQVNLVDWLKVMVGSRRSEEVVDPNIDTRPSTRALKRALLTALRCVDPDSDKRPRMSQVVRMLESEEYPIPREVSV